MACAPEYLPHSSKQGAIALVLQRRDRLLRQCDTRVLERLKASIEVYEAELQAQRCRQSFQYPPSCRDDFATNAIARYQAYPERSCSH